MRKWFFRLVLLLVSPLLLIVVYLIAALIGALIPASLNTIEDEGSKLERPIYLIANLLHTDIAIPLNSLSLEEFSFLRESGFPLDNPNLEYLVFGWGSEAFYTSTKEYSDIEIETAWKAVTGDKSVMHVAPAGDISDSGLIALNMPDENLAKLVSFISASFAKQNSKPVHLTDKTFGFGDVFYKANGNFNILNPCNQWVSEALRKAGFGTGIWTPTAYSFSIGHELYN